MINKIIHLLLFFALWLPISGFSHAGDFVQRIFDGRDGLSNSMVNAIAFDEYGFVWVATEDGLFRVSRTLTRRVDTYQGVPRVENSLFYDVVPAGRDYLLISLSDTLLRYHIPTDTFEPLGENGLAVAYEGGGTVARTWVDEQTLLILTNKSEVLRLDTERWTIEKLMQLPHDPDVRWDKILHLDDGSILLGKQYQLEVRTAQGEKRFDLPWLDSYGQAKQLFRDRNGRVWLTSSEGLREIDIQRKAISPVPEVPFYVTAVADDAKGNLWLSSRERVLKWNTSTRQLTELESNVRNMANIDHVASIAVDKDGLIWIGGAGDGLVLAVDRPDFILDSFNRQSPYHLGNQVVWAIYAEGDNYWFGTDGGVVRTQAGKSGSSLSAPNDFEQNDSVYNIMSLDSEHLLVSTTNGLFVQHKASGATKRFAEWSKGSDSLEYKWIYSAYRDPAIPDRIWFLTATGLFYWQKGELEPQEFIIHSRSGRREQPPIHSMLRGSDGKLWIGGFDEFGYIDADGYFIDKKEMLKVGDSDLAVGQIAEISPGVLWIGTSMSGVFEYQIASEKLRSLKNDWKLSCYITFGIVETTNHRIIICPRSLIRQAKSTGEIKVFSARDGFISGELNEGAFFYQPGKGLLLGSPEGVKLIDTNTLKNRIADDKVFLESVMVHYDDRVKTFLTPGDNTQIEAGARMVTLQLSSYDYLDDSPIQFRYQMLRPGQKQPDKYLQFDGQSQLNVSGLSAGELDLKVLSKQNDVWSESPFVHQLTVQVYWWETRWFKLLLLIGVMALTLAIIIVRQHQVSRFRAINSALQESEDRLRQSLRGSDSDLWLWTRKNNQFYLDNRNGVLSGEEDEIVLSLDGFPIHADDKERVLKQWFAVVDGEIERFDVEYRFHRSSGVLGWLRVRGRPSEVNHETGCIEKISGIYSDITQHKELQNEVDLLAQAFENTSEGVLILDATEQVKVANRAAEKILDVSSKQLVGRKFFTLLTDFASNRSEIIGLLEGELSWTGERELRVTNGQVCPVWLNVSAMLGANAKVHHYVVVFSDITERKRTEADLRRLANYDVLTGLPNRSLFASRLNQAISKATQKDEKLALLFLDLDRFKHVNDSFGHSMGDALLVEAAARLQSCLDPENTLCRFGGDEFVVLVHGAQFDTLNHLANAMLAQIETPFKLFGREFFISTSIGIAIWPDDARQPETLIKNADLAMYHAKEEGRGNFQYYSQQRNAEALYHLRLEADLRKALENNEFYLCYQPQIDVSSGDNAVVGAEALLRWKHPKDGLVRTDIFIKVAESCGLVIDLDRWVLRHACIDGARWANLLGRPFMLSVNVSAVQFRQPDFIDNLKQTLDETGMPVSCLTLEITEGVLMKELQVARPHLRQLKEMGVQVAIDDFGTGYSSLAYLRHFDVNVLKIDRSFLFDIADNQADQAIVSSIIELARNLKLELVAEGVETEDQLREVSLRGCNVIQGYYFAKPMSRAELDEYLNLEVASSLPNALVSG